MIQYKPYNLFIHANARSRRGDPPFEPAKGPLAEAYELRIRVSLNAINDWAVGRALISSLVSWVPVYITPYIAGGCNARTGQMTGDFTDGIRIQYSPETWQYDECGRMPGYRPVETLFHELVHASRFTSLGFDGLEKAPMDLMQDPEEFLAVMMTNVFRSEQGARFFNRDYRTGRLVTQLQLEAFLSSRRDLLDSLELFLSDGLVQAVVRLNSPFNPFRDVQRLRSIQRPVVPSGPTRIA